MHGAIMQSEDVTPERELWFTNDITAVPCPVAA